MTDTRQPPTERHCENRAEIKLRLAAFAFARCGPPVDDKDSNGNASNAELLKAARDYADAYKAERSPR